MKKRKLIAAFMGALCIAAAIPSVPAFADGQKVVTLGADLSEDQKQAILRYFGVSGQNIQTLTITNQDERDHLGSYVPLEQIGTHTYSCAFVNPTASGGIQVKTANLTWVTSNMIATTLSTSGVVNCEVLAASPFEVSGTGALTGILMAYESAVGTQLDTTKKEIATQELITTTTIANNIGQVQATDIVNESKKQVIQGNVVNTSDIDVIVNSVASEENIYLSEEDHELLVDLLRQISEQNYNYEDMKTTLERVEQNMDDLMDQQAAQDPTQDQTAAPAEEPQTEAEAQEETETPETLAPDSILSNTDDSALGDLTLFDATDKAALTEQPETESIPSDDGFDIFSSDSYTSDTPSDGAQAPVLPDGSTPAEPAPDGDGQNMTPVLPGQEGTPAPEMQEIPAPEQQAEIPAPAPEEIPAPEGDDYGTDTMMPDFEDPMFEVPEAPADENTAPQTVFITADEMDFAPATENDEMLPAGINELTISVPRTDLVPGAGSLTIAANDGSSMETVAAGDATKVSIAPLDSEELLDLGWGEGSKMTVLLSTPLAASTTYSVTMTEGMLTSADGMAVTAAVEDPAAWQIQTYWYGFSIDKMNLTAGNMVSGQIMTDTAPLARIENADPAMIAFDATEFYGPSSFTATLYAPGKTTFQVVFYDEAGNVLDSFDYTLNIR